MIKLVVSPIRFTSLKTAVNRDFVVKPELGKKTLKKSEKTKDKRRAEKDALELDQANTANSSKAATKSPK